MTSNIVEHTKPDDVPTAPIHILRQVIGLRKKSTRHFRRSAGDHNESAREKYASREHIIKVLERVLGKFEDLMAKAIKPAEAKSANGIKRDLADLNNMFEHLELQISPADDDGTSEIENQAENFTTTKKTTKKWRNGGNKLQKGGKAKKQQKPRPQPQEPQDPPWLGDSEFDLDYDVGDNEFNYNMMLYCFFENFNIIYVDDSASKQGIWDRVNDPVETIKNFNAFIPTNVLDPKPGNGPLDEGDHRTRDFENAVRVRHLLSKRYTSSDRENMFFMKYMQGMIWELLEHEGEKLESENDLVAVLQDVSASKYGGQPHSRESSSRNAVSSPRKD